MEVNVHPDRTNKGRTNRRLFVHPYGKWRNEQIMHEIRQNLALEQWDKTPRWAGLLASETSIKAVGGGEEWDENGVRFDRLYFFSSVLDRVYRLIISDVTGGIYPKRIMKTKRGGDDITSRSSRPKQKCEQWNALGAVISVPTHDYPPTTRKVKHRGPIRIFDEDVYLPICRCSHSDLETLWRSIFCVTVSDDSIAPQCLPSPVEYSSLIWIVDIDSSCEVAQSSLTVFLRHNKILRACVK